MKASTHILHTLNLSENTAKWGGANLLGEMKVVDGFIGHMLLCPHNKVITTEGRVSTFSPGLSSGARKSAMGLKARLIQPEGWDGKLGGSLSQHLDHHLRKAEKSEKLR